MGTMNWREFERDAMSASVAQLSHQLHGLVTADDINRHVRAEIELYDRWRSDPDRAIRFQSSVPIKQARPDDYKLKLLATKSGSVLAGIRFSEGNIRHPFVQIYTSDGFVSQLETDLVGSLRTILAAFAVFGAKRVRLHLPAGCDFGRDVREVVSTLTVAGLISNIAADPDPRSGIAIRRAVAPDLHDFYARCYERHRILNPRLAKRVRPLSPQDFGDIQKSGKLFYILLNEQVVGLLALRAAYRFGMRGFMIEDEVVDPRASGNRLAATAQRAAATQLRDARRQILFGEIAPENIRSLRAAQQAGRTVVGKCSFLSLA